MVLASDIGARLEIDPAEATLAWLFGEDQARYLIAAADSAGVLQRAADAGVPAQRIGTTEGAGGAALLTLPGADPISVNELRGLHEGWFPHYMANA